MGITQPRQQNALNYSQALIFLLSTYPSAEQDSQEAIFTLDRTQTQRDISECLGAPGKQHTLKHSLLRKTNLQARIRCGTP